MFEIISVFLKKYIVFEIFMWKNFYRVIIY